MSTYDTLHTNAKGSVFSEEEIMNHNLRFLIINCLIGSIAGMNALLIMYPFYLVRRNLHLNGSTPKHNYDGAFDVVKQTIKREGLKGLYRGLYLSAIKSVPSTAICFMVNE